jgi:hypothetical protein
MGFHVQQLSGQREQIVSRRDARNGQASDDDKQVHTDFYDAEEPPPHLSNDASGVDRGTVDTAFCEVSCNHVVTGAMYIGKLVFRSTRSPA